MQHEYESQIAELRSEHAVERTRADHLSDSLETLHESHDDLQRQFSLVNAQLGNELVQHGKQVALIKETSAEIFVEETNIHKERDERLRAELEESQRLHAESRAELEDAVSQRSQANLRVRQLGTRLRSFQEAWEARSKTMVTEMCELRRAHDSMQERHNALDAQLSGTTSEYAEATQRVRDLSSQLSEMRRNARIATNAESLASELVSLRASHRTIQAHHRNLLKFLKGQQDHGGFCWSPMSPIANSTGLVDSDLSCRTGDSSDQIQPEFQQLCIGTPLSPSACSTQFLAGSSIPQCASASFLHLVEKDPSTPSARVKESVLNDPLQGRSEFQMLTPSDVSTERPDQCSPLPPLDTNIVSTPPLQDDTRNDCKSQPSMSIKEYEQTGRQDGNGAGEFPDDQALVAQHDTSVATEDSLPNGVGNTPTLDGDCSTPPPPPLDGDSSMISQDASNSGHNVPLSTPSRHNRAEKDHDHRQANSSKPGRQFSAHSSWSGQSRSPDGSTTSETLATPPRSARLVQRDASSNDNWLSEPSIVVPEVESKVGLVELIFRSASLGMEGFAARLSEWTPFSQRIEGPLVYLERNAKGEWKYTQNEVRGCVVLVRRSPGISFAAKAHNAAAGGAAGILVCNDRDTEGDLCRMGLFGAAPPGIPAAIVSRVDGEGLIRRVSRGDEIRVHFMLQTGNWVDIPIQSNNEVEDLASTTGSSGGVSGPPVHVATSGTSIAAPALVVGPLSGVSVPAATLAPVPCSPARIQAAGQPCNFWLGTPPHANSVCKATQLRSASAQVQQAQTHLFPRELRREPHVKAASPQPAPRQSQQAQRGLRSVLGPTQEPIFRAL